MCYPASRGHGNSHVLGLRISTKTNTAPAFHAQAATAYPSVLLRSPDHLPPVVRVTPRGGKVVAWGIGVCKTSWRETGLYQLVTPKIAILVRMTELWLRRLVM